MTRHSVELRGPEFSGKTGPRLKRLPTKAEVEARTARGGVAPQDAPIVGHSAQKYQRILDAAVEVIAENGYFHSPVSAIAARAGVADGTVYLYFKSKDDLLRVAIARIVDTFFAKLEERFKTVTGPREQLQYVAELHLETSTTNRSVAILLQTEMRQSARFVAEFSHPHLVRYIQAVREIVRRGQQQGLFRPNISDGIVAHCLFGAIDELLSSAVFTSRDFDVKSTASQVIDVLLNGIGTENK